MDLLRIELKPLPCEGSILPLDYRSIKTLKKPAFLIVYTMVYGDYPVCL